MWRSIEDRGDYEGRAMERMEGSGCNGGVGVTVGGSRVRDMPWDGRDESVVYRRRRRRLAFHGVVLHTTYIEDGKGFTAGGPLRRSSALLQTIAIAS